MLRRNILTKVKSIWLIFTSFFHYLANTAIAVPVQEKLYKLFSPL